MTPPLAPFPPSDDDRFTRAVRAAVLTSTQTPGVAARDRAVEALRAWLVTPSHPVSHPAAERASVHVQPARIRPTYVQPARGQPARGQPARGQALPASSRGRVRQWYRPAIWSAVVVGAVFLAVIARSTFTASVSGSGTAVTRQYATHAEQRATITLPDGSRATLAPLTQLAFQSAPSGTRTITIDGEAFFDVVHDPARPFVVLAGPTRTDVLGTAFSVRRYATDRATRVAVVDGRVAIGAAARSTHAPLILSRGMIGDATDSSATRVPGDAVSSTTWMQGRLVFDDASVAAMLATLGRWYGYDFRLTDSTLARRTVTVTFNADRRQETMDELKQMLGVTMTFDGRTVVLRPLQGSTTRRPARSIRDLTPNRTEVGK